MVCGLTDNTRCSHQAIASAVARGKRATVRLVDSRSIPVMRSSWAAYTGGPVARHSQPVSEPAGIVSSALSKLDLAAAT